MFSGLRQNGIIYILEKTETPQLKTAQVVSVSNPTPRYNAQQYAAPALYGTPGTQQEQVVDIRVRIDGEEQEFKQLPASNTIANSGNMVVADNREAMLSEVEGMRRTSQSILDSTEHHQRVVDVTEEMLAQLNPQLAKEKANDQRIGAMEQRMGGMETTLTNIQEMLASALSKTRTTTK